jgi:hypothetical protein
MKLLFAMLMVVGCAGESTREQPNDKVFAELPAATTDKSGSGNNPEPVPAFSLEDAETITARHYSQLNSDAKYPLYKGLLVKIDQIDSTSRDSIRFTSTVTGRKWMTPNGDTATQAFRETKEFSVFRADSQWQGIARERRD